MVRALASDKCGPGAIRGSGITCGLIEFVDGSLLAPRGFSLDTPGFFLSRKTNTAKVQVDLQCTLKMFCG